MNVETIIKAAIETSNYYLLVKKNVEIAEAFELFAAAIEQEVFKEGLKREQDNNDALEDSLGSHGQG